MIDISVVVVQGNEQTLDDSRWVGLNPKLGERDEQQPPEYFTSTNSTLMQCVKKHL